MKLTLKNFQSISDAEVEIGPLTVLVGQSDVGKSAVIRALYLLHRNQGGLELVKHGKSKLEVTQYLDSGLRVAITKGKGVNNYFSGSSTYCKVGRDVPDEVSRNLRTPELVLDKDQSLDLNFCRQFDTPFLLSDSTTVITKAVSSLSGINIVYAAIREGNSEYQKSKTKAEVLQGNVSDLLKYETLSKEVDALLETVREIKALQSSIEDEKKRVIYYKTLLDGMESLQAREADLAPFEFKLQEVLSLWKDGQGLQTKKSSLEVLLDRMQGVHPYSLSDELPKDIAVLETSLGSLVESFELLKTESTLLSKSKVLFAGFVDIDSRQAELESRLFDYQGQIKSLEEQVKICPTCQRPL
ncbi:AAA ATPase domain protein [uncultured archaeon]|nr:AAA ATPase domain protein [uncultured archaeon]